MLAMTDQLLILSTLFDLHVVVRSLYEKSTIQISVLNTFPAIYLSLKIINTKSKTLTFELF